MTKEVPGPTYASLPRLQSHQRTLDEISASLHLTDRQQICLRNALLRTENGTDHQKEERPWCSLLGVGGEVEAKGCVPLRPIDDPDIFYTGSQIPLPVQKASDLAVVSAAVATTTAAVSSSAGNICGSIIHLFDAGLFRVPGYVFVLVYATLLQFSYVVPFTHLYELAQQYGIAMSETPKMMAAMGVMNAVGRLAAGMAASYGRVNPIWMSMIFCLVGGLCHFLILCLAPINMISLTTYSAMYGLTNAIPIPLFSLIMMRFIALNRLTSAFANKNMIKGLIAMGGPMLAGWLVSRYGDHLMALYLCGTCMLLAGLAHIALLLLLARQNEQRKLSSATLQL